MRDVVTAIRHNVTIDELGHRRRFADSYLKSPEEMSGCSAAIQKPLPVPSRSWALQIPARRTRLPVSRQDDPDLTPRRRRKAHLGRCGGRYRGPAGQGAAASNRLGLIQKLGYAPYFLTVNSIVRFARSKGSSVRAGFGRERFDLLCARHHLDRSGPE